MWLGEPSDFLSFFPCCLPDGCRYEDEEHPGVCQAMESTAELFLQDGMQPGGEQDAGGAEQEQQQEGVGPGSGRVVQIEEID